MFGKAFLEHYFFNHLTYRQFYDIFVVYGGSGATLSLVIAILINAKDKHTKHIAQLSIPFSIFNINEILIFGLPIAFNRDLIIPFILVPLVNLSMTYAIFFFFPVTFTAYSYPWITPTLFNAYFATGGNLWVIALQIFLIFLGAIIYMPFVQRYASIQSTTDQLRSLADKLNLTNALEAGEGLAAYQAKSAIIKSNHELEGIIKLLNSNNLKVFYQPKINIEQFNCEAFEALLRLELTDGKIIGPYFLEHIEHSGLAPILDLWVCNKVNSDLSKWLETGFSPTISVNLHPDTISDTHAIQQIIAMFQNKKIDFEIIERSMTNGIKAENNLRLIRENNFTLSIDDFGVGYSSLLTLIKVPFNYIKIDKSLIDFIHTHEGYWVCQHIANMCTSVGGITVAEGVETEAQLNLIRIMGIKYVQGYYYSPAIPFNQVIDFTSKCNYY